MEQLLLLQGVHEVSLLADPSAPTGISQRAFDAARAASTFPDLPPARNITRALGVPWDEVLGLAHEPEAVRAQRLSMKHKDVTKDWLDDENVIFALRLVARRLGSNSLSLSQYRFEREKMLAADRAHYLHGGQLLLPNEEQVITRVGSWPNALRLAGLKEAPRRDPRVRRGVALVDLMERFYEHYGTRPTKPALAEFAAGNGIPSQRPINPSFPEALAQWQAMRAAQGLPAAPEPPPVSERPDYSRDVGAARPGERRFPRQRTQEECIAWMRRYLEDLPPRARSKQRSYRDWAKAHEEAPSPNTFNQYGGFVRVRSLAQDEMHAASKS